MAIFQGMWSQITKMETTFSMENGVPNTTLKFFPKKPHTGLMKAKKSVLGAHFPHISGSIGPIVNKKKIGFTRVWTRTNHVNFMNISSKLRPVS